MNYYYTAVLERIEDGSGYYARVPDLKGCVTSGRDIHDAIAQITDAANGWLVVAEDEGLAVPTATPQKDIEIATNALMTLIEADTILYRANTETRAVRKNVSLPAWMARLADKLNINCSKVLQDGLLALFNEHSF